MRQLFRRSTQLLARLNDLLGRALDLLFHTSSRSGNCYDVYSIVPSKYARNGHDPLNTLLPIQVPSASSRQPDIGKELALRSEGLVGQAWQFRRLYALLQCFL